MTIKEIRTNFAYGAFGGTYTADTVAFLLRLIDEYEVELERKAGLTTLYVDSLHIISELTASNERQKEALRNIAAWLGYDYLHVGGDVHFLQTQIDEVRDVANKALEE